MSLLNNNKKGKAKQSGAVKGNNAANSKFIKPATKSMNVPKQVRSTGANRGS